MYERLEAIHLLLTKVVCLQSCGGLKGAPLRRPPREVQGSHEASTAAGCDVLRHSVAEENSPDTTNRVSRVKLRGN